MARTKHPKPRPGEKPTSTLRRRLAELEAEMRGIEAELDHIAWSHRELSGVDEHY